MNGERHLLAKWFPLELHMVVRISGIRKFTFDVSNLKSATKPFNLLLACTCPLVTEFADN